MRVLLSFSALSIAVAVFLLGACNKTQQTGPQLRTDLETPPDRPIPPEVSEPTDAIEVDEFPEMLYYAPAEYPASSKIRGEEGVVRVQVLIDPEGTVRRILTPESSGHAQLDMAARRAARKCKFKPAYADSKPVWCWVSWTYEFTLRRP